MRLYRANGGICEIGHAARAAIEGHVQRNAHAPEAGGVLLGRLIVESNDVVIDEATVPGPEDRRGRTFFFRSRRRAQRRIERTWVRTNGTSIYLGEWHTHPEDDPVPSRVDMTDWDRIVRNAKFEQAFLFFLIAGRQRWRAWEVTARSCKVQALEIVDG